MCRTPETVLFCSGIGSILRIPVSRGSRFFRAGSVFPGFGRFRFGSRFSLGGFFGGFGRFFIVDDGRNGGAAEFNARTVFHLEYEGLFPDGGNFAVTTTSGPGLSLKSGAMGLAVMAELPIVIVDVQRGGPSTGLPTKTEQSDLMQALYGRNGECPVVVIAASSPSDCFHYAFMAGKIALEHMTPVILLTDGFIANGSEPWRIPSMQDYPAIVPPIVNKAPEEGEFMPYKRDERLVRGWAFPGKKGLEHRIGGLEKDHLKGSISYDPANHQEMVLTRAAKVARVADDLPSPTIDGAADADLLVIGWGGTRGHLQTAVDDLKAEGKSIAHLHLNYIYPLPKGLRELLEGHKHIIVCELNEGQMAAYLRQNFQEFNFEQYNKCEGQPFTVAELKEKFVSLL